MGAARWLVLRYGACLIANCGRNRLGIIPFNAFDFEDHEHVA